MSGLRYGCYLASASCGLAVLLSLAGCSSKFKYVPVQGKVSLKKNGDPVTFGFIACYPEDGNEFKGIASAKINPDGTYVLTSDKDGVPIGKYIVCVRGPMRQKMPDGKAPPPITFSDKYTDSGGSPLRIEVVANAAPGAYDLVLD